MRKKLYNIIAVSLLLMIVIPNSTLAIDIDSVTEMATALDKLTILKGNGTDYNLSGQLKRSEAAAFLVRLLGVENKVIEDKDRYIKTNYSDVDPSKWYSYYIGYVSSAGLVNGYKDGTFKPDIYVSEKEFTKMILGALNYKQGIDYEWDDIYQFAHSIGLFSDDYKDRKEDNVNYKRKDTIELMYKSLNKNINILQKTITERLLDRGFITDQQAIEAGVLVDTVKTTIETANAVSDNTIRITLSEEIEPITKEKVIISEEEKSSTIDIKSVNCNNNIVTITTDALVTGGKYKINFVEIIDKHGFKTSNLETVFDGYVETVVESNYFKIAKVKVVSKNVINVYFTQPINQGAAIPLYYTIKQGKDVLVECNFDNIGISKLGEVDNGVSIFLKGKDLQEGLEYSIVVEGKLTSDYSVRLNDGNDEEMSFIGTESPNQNFEIVDVEPIDKKYIIVTFNKDIDNTSATDRSNYELKDKNGNYTGRALGAVAIGDGIEKYRKVKLMFATIASSHEYELTIDGVKDSFKQMTISDEIYPFYGYREADAGIKIEYVYAENRNTVVVYFNNDVNSDIIDANYIMNGISIISKQYDPRDPKKITLYTSDGTPLLEGANYNLKILNARDEFGQLYMGDIEYEFEGNPIEFGDIDISECKFIADDMVYVEFDKNISRSSTLASQFTLEYGDSDDKKRNQAKNIIFIDDRTLAVRFKSTSYNEQYRLKVEHLQDYSEQFTTSSTSRTVNR